MRKKSPYSELLWSAFSRIRTEYGEILRENVDQNNTEYGHFLHIINLAIFTNKRVLFVIFLPDKPESIEGAELINLASPFWYS